MMEFYSANYTTSFFSSTKVLSLSTFCAYIIKIFPCTFGMSTICTHIFRRFKIQFTKGTISRRIWYPRVDSKKINVILLQDVPNLGTSGQIVETSRGYANYNLIPNGCAVYANWYNIDLYANKNPANHRRFRDEGIENQTETRVSNGGYNIFTDFNGKFVIGFNVSTIDRDKELISSPISLYQVLDTLSNQYFVDILPSQILNIKFNSNDVAIDHGSDYNNIVFNRIGMYEFLVKFPLHVDLDNTLIFKMNIGSEITDNISSDELEFKLPENV